jgi:CRP/FNR family cyclic AMP-dependent transcriptional regulator
LGRASIVPSPSAFHVACAGRFQSDGKEATIGLLGAEEFVGEACIVAAQPLRQTTATAIVESEVLRIARKEMVSVLHEQHTFSDVFVSFLLSRNARIQEDLVDQLFNSSEKRLARILLLLAQFGKEGKPEKVIPKMSQETLAEMIGTTRSRVSFFMNRFRKLGFIEYNGRMEVHSSLLNVMRSGMMNGTFDDGLPSASSVSGKGFLSLSWNVLSFMTFHDSVASASFLSESISLRPALDRGDAVGRAYGLAIVELESVAQRENVSELVFAELPFVDHLRLDFELLVRGEQGVVHHVAVIARDVRGGPDRIEAAQVGLRDELEHGLRQCRRGCGNCPAQDQPLNRASSCRDSKRS